MKKEQLKGPSRSDGHLAEHDQNECEIYCVVKVLKVVSPVDFPQKTPKKLYFPKRSGIFHRVCIYQICIRSRIYQYV